MSTDALTLTSQALQAAVKRVLGDATAVVLTDPAQGDGKVSVWLYQVGVDEFGRNAPTGVAEDKTATRQRAALPPLGVNLYYLITPVMATPEADQRALAQIMLGLYEEGPLLVRDEDGGSDLVRISPVPDQLDDRARLWESLGKPYRLCVCYVLRTVRLRSGQTVQVAPVAVAGAGVPGNGAANR